MRPDFVCGGDLNAEMDEDGTPSDRHLNEMCTRLSLTSLQPREPTYQKGAAKSRVDHWLVSSGLVGAMRGAGRAVRISDHWGVRLEYTPCARGSSSAGWGDERPHKPRMHKL